MYIFQKVNKCGGCLKKGEIKNPRHFDNIFRAFIPFSPVKSLSSGLWYLKLSHGNLLRGFSWSLNLSSALVAQPLPSPLTLHAFIFLACFVSGFNCTVLCFNVVSHLCFSLSLLDNSFRYTGHGNRRWFMGRDGLSSPSPPRSLQ